MVSLIPQNLYSLRVFAVLDWKPYKHAEIYKATVRGKFNAVYTQSTDPSQVDIWAAAGVEDYAAVTSRTGEPILKSMSNSGTSDSDIYIKDTSISAFELFQVHKRRAALRKEHLDYWQSTKASTSTGRPVDAVISPVAPFPPPPHGKNKRVSISTLPHCRRNADSFYSNAQYTLIWNALDYPACVFPVTQVDPVLDQPKGPHKFLSKEDKRVYELCTGYPIFLPWIPHADC